MKNSTKKWLLVAGCLVICAMLVALIGSSFSTEPVRDDIAIATDDPGGDVTVSPGAALNGTDPAGPEDNSTPAVVINPSRDIPSATVGGAVSSGAEQTIQPDVTRPEVDEDALTDPSKTPDGQEVEGRPEHIDHDAVDPSTAPQPSGGSQGGGSQSSGGGLPGFDNVPNAGANQGFQVDSDGDINKQVGIMD